MWFSGKRGLAPIFRLPSDWRSLAFFPAHGASAMTDGGYQAVRRAMWVDAEISGFEVARLDRPLRRVSGCVRAVE